MSAGIPSRNWVQIAGHALEESEKSQHRHELREIQVSTQTSRHDLPQVRDAVAIVEMLLHF
jgi:hypothetical protein